MILHSKYHVIRINSEPSKVWHRNAGLEVIRSSKEIIQITAASSAKRSSSESLLCHLGVLERCQVRLIQQICSSFQYCSTVTLYFPEIQLFQQLFICKTPTSVFRILPCRWKKEKEEILLCKQKEYDQVSEYECMGFCGRELSECLAQIRFTYILDTFPSNFFQHFAKWEGTQYHWEVNRFSDLLAVQRSNSTCPFYSGIEKLIIKTHYTFKNKMNTSCGGVYL